MDKIHTATFIIEAIIFLPTFIGNMLILMCLLKFKQLRSPMGILIGSLAVTDLLTGSVLIPLDLYGLHSSLYSHKYACLFRLGTFVALLGSSILHMLAISTERFVALAFPLKHISSKTMTVVKIFIPVAWTSMLSLGYIPLTGLNSYKTGIPCKYTVQFTDGYIYFVTIFYAVCVFINTGCFIAVIRIVVKSFTAHNEITKAKRSLKNLKKTYLMIVISALFVICWGPFCVLSFIGLFCKWKTYDITMRSCILIGFLNSGFNWIIYGLMNVKFRRAVLKILRLQKEETVNFSITYSQRVTSIRHI